MEKDTLSTAVSEPVILRNGSQPSIKGPDAGVAMTHISVAEEEGGNNVEWLEKVTEEQYTGN